MKPFYEDSSVTLYNADCIRHPDLWTDADVLVTDPPYGMKYQSNSAKAGPSTPIIGDQDTALRDDALELWGATKPALVFGTWRAHRPPTTRQLLVWHKGDTPGMGDLSLPWGPSHEEIYVLGGRGREHWTGKRGPSVIRSRQAENSATKDHDHPTPKPIYLMQALIAKTTGEVIADPFVGAGATLVAAKLLGRRAIGIELDAHYCAVTARRLEKIS